MEVICNCFALFYMSYTPSCRAMTAFISCLNLRPHLWNSQTQRNNQVRCHLEYWLHSLFTLVPELSPALLSADMWWRSSFSQHSSRRIKIPMLQPTQNLGFFLLKLFRLTQRRAWLCKYWVRQEIQGKV
jgi:hypothetical protein